MAGDKKSVEPGTLLVTMCYVSDVNGQRFSCSLPFRKGQDREEYVEHINDMLHASMDFDVYDHNPVLGNCQR